MKKRIASLSMLLCLLAVFFVVPVHAENTYVRQLRNYSNSISSVSLTYSATAAQFDYVTESTLSGGMYSPILITVRFTNNGSNDIKIANSYVDLTFTTYSEVSGYDCYTSDLMVQMVKNGNDTPRYNIVASNGFSYGGHIVVPALSSLYLVFEVDIAAHYDTSTAQVVSPSLDAVLVSVNSSDVTTGDYPTTGSIPEQLDELESYVAQLSGYTYGNGQSLANITSLLIAIKNQIVSTHTFSLDKLSSVAISGSSGWTAVTSSKDYNVFYYVSSPIPVSTAVAIDGITGNDLQYNVYRYHVDIIMAFRGIGMLYYGSGTYGLKLQTFGTNPISISNYEMKSTFSESYVRNVAGNIFYPYGRYEYNSIGTNFRSVIPSGRQLLVLSYDMYFDNTQTVNLVAPSEFGTNFIAGTLNEETTHNYINSDNMLLNLIYQGILGQTQQNADTVIDSNNAGSMSDQVHAQEEQWYRENDTAMENVGLSNYRYTQNQQNGIVGAVLQFEQMWLALGDWTLVYIFTLMLSLAVFILRHEPTTRMKQAREERSAFYAEAGRYYRESARPSNEFVQRVRKFNGK